MRIISMDLGWRTLAIAKLDVTDDAHVIHEWTLVDLIGDSAVNINQTTLEHLVTLANPKLNQVADECALFLKHGTVYLEQQPMGAMARNVKTKTLSHILQSLLLSRAMQVVFVSPKLKLQGIKGTYRDNKKHAVQSVYTFLDGDWLDYFEKHKKKDDLADALLQGIYAARRSVKPAKPKKPRKPRKPLALIDDVFD